MPIAGEPQASPGADHAEAVAAAFASSQRTVDRSLLLLGVLVLAGSVLMSPSADVLTVFGFEVPVMCAFRATTGLECLGCGMTRSFTFMAHLQPLQAFAAHRAGPLLFLLVVGQVPYRLWRLRRRSGWPS